MVLVERREILVGDKNFEIRYVIWVYLNLFVLKVFEWIFINKS